MCCWFLCNNCCCYKRISIHKLLEKPSDISDFISEETLRVVFKNRILYPRLCRSDRKYFSCLASRPQRYSIRENNRCTLCARRLILVNNFVEVVLHQWNIITSINQIISNLKARRNFYQYCLFSLSFSIF